MSQVPHRQAGEATFDLRRQQEQPCGGAVRGLRAIELLHDERRLLDQLGLCVPSGAAISLAGVSQSAPNAGALNVILFVCVVGVVQW